MFRCFVLGAGLILICGAFVRPGPAAPDKDLPGKEDQAAAGAKFRKNCQHCHRPPDLQFASDAAWLDQLKRTA